MRSVVKLLSFFTFFVLLITRALLPVYADNPKTCDDGIPFFSFPQIQDGEGEHEREKVIYVESDNFDLRINFCFDQAKSVEKIAFSGYERDTSDDPDDDKQLNVTRDMADSDLKYEARGDFFLEHDSGIYLMKFKVFYADGKDRLYQEKVLIVKDKSSNKSTPSNYGCTDLKGEEKTLCEDCLYEDGELTGAVWTELGCIDPSPTGLVTRIFQIGLGIMGGIAVLRFIQIAFAYQSGDPEKVKEAQEMTTSLIAGIVLLVLGVLILQFIGVNILGLPEGTFGG